MITIKQIRKINTIKDAEALNIGHVHCDISHRGGGVGFYSSDLAAELNIEQSELPRFFGAGCNYLGGGIRGSIFKSTFSPRITGKKAELLDEIAAAFIRVYQNIENEAGLNDEEDQDGETNWNAKATAAVRKGGIESAY